MRLQILCLCALLLASDNAGATSIAKPLASDADIAAAQHAPLHPYTQSGHWNEPVEPFRVIGNIYHVGTQGVNAYLITSPQGHVLIDGVVPQSVPQIIDNIHTLGFDIADVKYLLNTHAHYDHAGGLAGLQRASAARMIASAADRATLERGDIGYGPSAGMLFPPIRVNREIADGDTVRVGDTELTAHLTPGHTPGCTSWSLNVADNSGTSRSVFIHCSATVAGQSLVPESYPGMIDAFRASFDKVAHIQADVFLANHPNFFDFEEKRARQIAGDANAFIDPDGLQRYNEAMRAAFEKELARQQAKR
jgi:metallo-beta-lactamase class B